MPSASRPTFTAQVARLHGELTRDGVPVSDMRGAQSLESQLAGVADLGGRPAPRPADARRGIEPLEGPIEARAVPRLPPRASRLRYFLDGAQRTFLVWRCGLVPVAATVAAAGILARDQDGRCELVPGTLRLEHAWLIPRRAASPQLAALLRRIDAVGMTVADPLERVEDAAEYAAAAGDYGRLVELAYDRARKVREGLELDLLRRWAADPARAGDDGWIVVDGRLHAVVPRALGLVKQFGDSYLTGADAETLLNLAPGHRTTAFFPTDRYRGIGANGNGAADHDPDARTLWYLRLWDATGLDARHALVRVEAGPDLRASHEIDEVSAWLLAERTPRATADARWATLLYPVHYLERILKRSLEADTRGWPGA